MTDTTTQPDAIQLLTADHADVEQMFRAAVMDKARDAMKRG